MMKPMVNINGTSPVTLVEHRRDAMAALQGALEALLELRPHGRDYQGYADNEQYEADLKLHNARLAMVYGLKLEIQTEALAIMGGE